jgi:hypothetical protein
MKGTRPFIFTKGTHPFIFTKGTHPSTNMKGRVPFTNYLKPKTRLAVRTWSVSSVPGSTSVLCRTW